MLEFKIQNEQLPIIKVNYEEVKAALNNTLSQYKGIVVTEESLSAAKQEQKNLASIRVKIDGYRKDKKKELSKPIVDFENQCKDLIELVEQAEKPIKEGIAIFDNKKREEKKQAVLKLLSESVEEHQLNEKFAKGLTVLDKYLNATATLKSIKEDIELRTFNLVSEQAKEEEMVQVIKATIDNANLTINTKIEFKEFQNLINAGVSVPNIIARINQMAEKIRLAEMPKEEIKNDIPQKTQEAPPVQPEEVKESKTYEPKISEPTYFVELKMTGSRDQVAQLSEYLKSNNIQYTVLNKGIHKE
jgi:hypothetical protein